MREWIINHPKETKIIVAVIVGWIIFTMIFNPMQALVYFLLLGVIPVINFQMGFWTTMLFCIVSSYFIWQWGQKVLRDLDEFVDYINLMESKEIVKSKTSAKPVETPKIKFEDLTIHNL